MADVRRSAWPEVDVLLVDDHRVFAEALAMRLSSEPEIGRVRVADDLDSARAELAGLGGGLVLLDYQMGDACGLDLMADIDRLEVRPTVVVVSGTNDADAIVAGLRAGVDAWMLKSDGYGALVEVSIAARDHVMTLPHRSLSEVVRRLVSAHRDAPPPPRSSTTSRHASWTCSACSSPACAATRSRPGCTSRRTPCVPTSSTSSRGPGSTPPSRWWPALARPA